MLNWIGAQTKLNILVMMPKTNLVKWPQELENSLGMQFRIGVFWECCLYWLVLYYTTAERDREYLQTRMQTFGDHPLKPKHHYLNHYPELILHFWRPIHLWTLRFRSKHTYLKQCARKLHHFKNLWNPSWKTSAFAVFLKCWNPIPTICCDRDGKWIYCRGLQW